MMAEYNLFSQLIEKHGVPRIVIPNTPCCHFRRVNSGSYFTAAAPPDGLDAFHSRVVYCRIPIGGEPFLQIRQYFEVDARSVHAARDALLEMRVVELLRGGTKRGPRGGTKAVVRIAVKEDVSPLGSGELGEAIKQRRLLAVDAERSMGDRYLRFEVVKAADHGGTGTFWFLFDAPCRLIDAELSFSPSEGSWSSPGAAIDDFRQQFTRALLR